MNTRGKYIKFYGLQTKIIDTNTQEEFSARIEENDRFFSTLGQYLEAEKVQGETTIKIDSFIVPMEVYHNLKSARYDIELLCMVGTKNGNEYLFENTYKVKIPNVVIRFASYSDVKNIDSQYMNLIMHELVIPYKTEFDVSEIIELD